MSTLEERMAAFKDYERKLEVVAKPLAPNKMYGFRSEAATGSGEDGITFELDHSFGMGSLAVMLTVKRDGKTIGEESINFGPVVQRWVNAIVEGEQPDAATP